MARSLRFSPLILGIFLLAGFLAYLNWPAEEQAQQRRGGGATPVVAETVSVEPFAIVIEALGTAQANESVELTAQQAQTVKLIAFDDGDIVEKGDLLVELNNRAEIARVNELEINIADAKRQLQRIENLAKDRVASQQLLDEQRARVDALSAQLDVAQANLSELKIHAPFSGKLGLRQVSIGTLVRPGDVITTLDDIERVKVDFNLSETHLASVSKGQSVTAASVAYPGETFTGQISTIDARLDPMTRSINVRAIIDNPEGKLRPGMLLQITVQKRVLNTIVIPEKALIPNQEKQFVFVIEEGIAHSREVKVGERRPGIAQITSGLSPGETIVTEGTLRLRDQSPVQILDTK
ncbi:efflux RND transporter periplasmic adaptor subunit [Alteromonas oceanisediminis]|uniref:efflux RND transporter periplasmic adaptor subunit n=1 Tax=Alteromonas oceanisediminis TaxID=2836180 RepID=UPI001BDAC715|nr:efflux RND transporter periplasmic adaptor subunit [Alteromonas oceanisediminis]MBT0585313.1 efflux RND transporter periplasmic adaptor subunit [Alteromonas oceanisediminis]